MSTILVNNVKSYTGDTVTISGSNILVQGKTTLGDGSGTDTLKVRADLSLSGSAQVSGSIIPARDDKHDLGSSTNEWKDLYVDGTAYIDSGSINHIHGVYYNNDSRISVSSSLIPTNDDAFDLGSSTKQWKDLYVDGTAYVDAISFDQTNGSSQDLASSAVYSVNGSKVSVKAITEASTADGAFVKFTLHNTSIIADSIVLGSFTGGTNGPITGSILTAATIGTSTASIQIHNETGITVAANASFTASFIVL